jgi:hypothetical protein
MMSNDSLINLIECNTILVRHQNMSFGDMQTMLPWERYLMIEMIKRQIQKEKEK